jgi:pyruvate/2-oxoglutarate dehydrogenase complex dihydrolipoamide dehydrogenase (E3) component
MDANRKAIRQGKDKSVTQAADAVAKAQKALDKACDTRAINTAKAAADEAAKTFDEKHNEWFSKIPEYQQLTAKEEELQKKLAAMDKDVLDATSPKAIKKLAPDIQKASQELGELGYKVKMGKFFFLANGKALGLGERDGFAKIVADRVSGEILGAHLVGPEVTELLPELVLARTCELTPEEIAHSVHAHPTLSEVVAEASLGVFGKPIHA